MPTPFAFTNTPTTSSTPPSPKLNLTTGTLPRYITPSQPPNTKPPFPQIHAVPFIASTTLLLPTELHTLLRPHLPAVLLAPHHAHLHLTLTELLSAPLLTHIQTPGTYISLLTTNTTPGVDDARYSLRSDGMLRLELSRELYERAGLQGRIVQSGGRKHVRDRYVVEFDLRSAAMREGKKGFERLRWAAREVLGERRTWVGVVSGGAGRGVFEGLEPEWRGGVAKERDEGAWKVPEGLLTGRDWEGLVDEEDVWALGEWADLVALGSERVRDADVVDEFVSRYEVPGDGDGGTAVGGVTVSRWTGLLESRWVLELLMELVKGSRIQRSGMRQWAVLSVTGHQIEAVGNVDGYHIVLQPEREESGAAEKPTEPGLEASSAVAGIKQGFNIDEHGQGDDEMDVGGLTADTVRAGFQRFMCMQLVDTMQL